MATTAQQYRATRIDDPTARCIIENAHITMGIAIALINQPQRRGASFFLASFDSDPTDGDPKIVTFCHEPVGMVKSEKAKKYFDLSAEKATRLNRMYDERGDLSSWQSRNPDEQQWGGAIIAGDWVLSCSGLPELWDEAVMLATAVISGILAYADAKHIAGLSGNARFVEIGVTLGWLTPETI